MTTSSNRSTALAFAGENGEDRAATPPWEAMSASDEFRDLLRQKTRFIVGATAFFLVYYFALPILSGYFPELMSRKVIGQFSLAYVFAFTQFPMAWLVAAFYLRAASKFDRQAAAIASPYVANTAPDSEEDDAE